MLNQDSQFSILQTLEQSLHYLQRDLVNKLRMSLNKANYRLNSLIDKGLVKVRNLKNSHNKTQYTYLLTLQSISKKSELTTQFLQGKTEQLKQRVRR
ncbi:MAG: hypothetical protein Ctma_0621 [Catillopecten margaritatus gill symbiont]|uniref:MarR family EPS-associated transcriptional regulator n=1 Tax=Catillopecten margaritatus gill symbiont TaxID=3083288 RepID=A0AAU6PGN3_9GAMM